MPLPLHLLRLSAFLFTGLTLAAQPYEAGGTYYGRQNYIEYRAGNLPLILTTGHGGDRTPAEIPDRTWGTLVTDTNTRELAIACYDEIVARTGRYPHLVISHLNRTKLDPNRDIVEGAQGNAPAEQAWNEFHNFIAAARASAESAYGFGHVMDIHGHGHTIGRLELGYALGASQLNRTDAVLNNPGYAWMSTFRTLALLRPGVPFSDLIRGERSLGDLFNLRSVPAWPSPQYPVIGDELFFDGGYIVRSHTCLLDNSTVNGVQIETHYGVRSSASTRATFASRFANVLQPYLWYNYGFDLGTISLARITPPANSLLVRGGGSLALTVRRTGYLGLSSTLALSFGGTAVRGAGGDYTASVSTLYFPADEDTATLTLAPAAAGPVFGDRTLEIALAPSATQSADLTPLVLTLSDGLSQIVRVSSPAGSVAEPAGAVTFRLTRTRTDDTLTVPLAWSGTAITGTDYEDPPATAVFPAGADSVDVTVPLVNDGRAEPDKTLVLSIGTPSAGLAGHPSSASVRLLDDDRPAGLALWLRGDLDGNIAPDSSDYRRHATTLPANGPSSNGPVPSATDGDDSPAIVFDGVDDTLALPRFTLDPDGAFTLAFHFRLDAGGTISSKNLFSYGTRGESGSLHLYLATTNVANGTVSLRTSLGGLSANALDVPLTSPQTWQDGVWRHYALAVAADGSARVYIDGQLMRTATGRSGRLSPDELAWFGWRPASGNSTSFLAGTLRDIRLYDHALPATGIPALATGRQTWAGWLAEKYPDTTSLPSVEPADGDLSPLLRYALGGDPVRATPLPGYKVWLENDRLRLRFLRETTASDLSWTVEASADAAGPWTPLARRTSSDTDWQVLAAGASVTESGGRVVVTDSVSAGSLPRRFLRVVVAVSGTTTASVATTPAGMMSFSVPAPLPGQAESWAYNAISLAKPVSASGRISAITVRDGLTLLTDDTAGWSDNSYNSAPGSRYSTHYLELVTGPARGMIADIVATSGAEHTLTLDGDLGNADLAGSIYRIREHWTLANLFGADNPPGLSRGSILNADLVSLWSGSSYNVFYYRETSTGQGWRNAANVSVNESGVVIYPDQGVFFTRRGSTALHLRYVGEIRHEPFSVRIEPGFNLISALAARDITLAESGLFTGSPETGLKAGATVTADTVAVWDGASFQVYYVRSTAAGLQGWRRADNVSIDASGALIPAGAAIIITRQPDLSGFFWNRPDIQ